jgi:hypothetical protein
MTLNCTEYKKKIVIQHLLTNFVIIKICLMRDLKFWKCIFKSCGMFNSIHCKKLPSFRSSVVHSSSRI